MVSSYCSRELLQCRETLAISPEGELSAQSFRHGWPFLHQLRTFYHERQLHLSGWYEHPEKSWPLAIVGPYPTRIGTRRQAVLHLDSGTVAEA